MIVSRKRLGIEGQGLAITNSKTVVDQIVLLLIFGLEAGETFGNGVLIWSDGVGF